MKKVALRVFFVAMALAISVIPAQSFNPAGHVYIADHLFPNHPNKTDLFYGSIAPDLAMYTDANKWRNHPFIDTHYTYMNLINSARGANQKAFAAGWYTHNELNGADHYAHGNYANGYADGYVTIQAFALLDLLGYPDAYLDFAHFAIEAAIDFLLKREHDPALGTKLLLANILRSPLDRELLTKVLVIQNPETDWATLITAEWTFRNIVHQYASALALPKPFDKNALVNLGVQLAQEQFGITATPELIRQVLDLAIGLCRASDYYQSAILPAIQNIALPR